MAPRTAAITGGQPLCTAAPVTPIPAWASTPLRQRQKGSHAAAAA